MSVSCTHVNCVFLTISFYYVFQKASMKKFFWKNNTGSLQENTDVKIWDEKISQLTNYVIIT